MTQKINLLVNGIILIDFAICAITGIFMKSRVFGNFSRVHVISGEILIVLVLIHLILNFDWIKNIPSLFKK